MNMNNYSKQEVQSKVLVLVLKALFLMGRVLRNQHFIMLSDSWVRISAVID